MNMLVERSSSLDAPALANALYPYFPAGRPSEHQSTQGNARLLIVHDATESRRILIEYFERHNIPLVCVEGREEMFQHVQDTEPSLILLDLGLRRYSGLDLLREIRSRLEIPVITITDRSDDMDRVVGLELGADDSLTRPFDPRELHARVRAVLRRKVFRQALSQRDPKFRVYKFADWRLDQRTRRLTNPAGMPVTLTKGDYALLVALVMAKGQPLTRARLLDATRIHEDIFDRSVDVQVLRLRRKLEPDASAPRMILTVRGIGYQFVPPVERVAPDIEKLMSTGLRS
jgi:two-component system OmpR family response regulator